MLRRLVTPLVLVPLLIVALVSFVFVRAHQNDGATLADSQRHAQTLTPGAVARVVKVAPDPVARVPGVRASCVPLGSGELHNPWHCTIHYRSGRVIQYRVAVTASGSYIGDHELLSYRGKTHPETGQISGCCISVP